MKAFVNLSRLISANFFFSLSLFLNFFQEVSSKVPKFDFLLERNFRLNRFNSFLWLQSWDGILKRRRFGFMRDSIDHLLENHTWGRLSHVCRGSREPWRHSSDRVQNSLWRFTRFFRRFRIRISFNISKNWMIFFGIFLFLFFLLGIFLLFQSKKPSQHWLHFFLLCWMLVSR